MQHLQCQEESASHFNILFGGARRNVYWQIIEKINDDDVVNKKHSKENKKEKQCIVNAKSSRGMKRKNENKQVSIKNIVQEQKIKRGKETKKENKDFKGDKENEANSFHPLTNISKENQDNLNANIVKSGDSDRKYDDSEFEGPIVEEKCFGELLTISNTSIFKEDIEDIGHQMENIENYKNKSICTIKDSPTNLVNTNHAKRKRGAEQVDENKHVLFSNTLPEKKIRRTREKKSAIKDLEEANSNEDNGINSLETISKENHDNLNANIVTSEDCDKKNDDSEFEGPIVEEKCFVELLTFSNTSKIREDIGDIGKKMENIEKYQNKALCAIKDNPIHLVDTNHVQENIKKT